MTTTLQRRPKTRKVLRHLMEKQQAVQSLGELILEQGGQPSVVVDALLDSC